MTERLPAHLPADGIRAPETDSRTPLRGREAELEAQVAALRQEVAGARAEIERLTSRCAELARLLRQAEQASESLGECGAGALRAEITAIRSSTSWHVTAPLRWAAINLRTATKLARSRRR